MFTGGLPGFNINDLTAFDNNNYDDKFSFDGFDWEILSNVAGPSQPYTGVDVQGDLNAYPEFPSPSSAPTSLYPAQGAIPNEGYNSPFYQGVAESSQQAGTTPPHPSTRYPTPPPIPAPPHGFETLSPESHNVPITSSAHSAQPQVVHNLDDLGFGSLTAAESPSLPAVHPSSPYIPSYEELWGKYPQSDSLRLDTPPFHPITGVTPPEISLPAPVASSSGPKRTRQPGREVRRYDPIKSAKKADSRSDGWDQALARFRAELDTLYNTYNGQPSGGLVPEMALATINKFVKEDLKRSPLRDTEAGKGRRSRDVEKYLEGLLRVIRPVAPTPTPAGAESNEDDTTAAVLSRLADELERKLAVVNQGSGLRRSAGASRRRTGDEQNSKKNGTEKARRDLERHHLERVSHLFRVSREQWSRKDVLSLVVLFLLYGSEAFPPTFVEVRPTVPGL